MALVQPRKVNPIPQAQPANTISQPPAQRQGIPAPQQTAPKRQWSAPKEEEIPVDENSNMRLWAQVCKTPDEACRDASNGKFNFTDINPMYRLRKLTEMFGPVGIGWYTEQEYEVLKYACAGDEVAVMCKLKFYYKDPLTGEWSKPIHGIGGNKLVLSGKLNDEGYKSAYTDALSIAFKNLGGCADIYYADDTTKYVYAEKAAKAEEKANARSKNAAQAESLKILNGYAPSSPLMPDDVTAILKALSEEFAAILNGTPDEGMSAIMEAQQALVDSGELPSEFSLADIPVKEAVGYINKIRSYIQAKVAVNTNTVQSFFSAKKEG